MSIALLIARLLLAVVFVVAGLGKLADLGGSRQAMRNFGVPVALAHPLGVLLPLAELAVAAALIPLAWAWWGAVGALALVLLFIAGIAFNLARGRRPDCHCFGQLYSKPIGRQTLIRNVVLAAIAGFIVGLGRSNAGLSATDWLAYLNLAGRIELAAGLILLALLVGEGWLLVQMLRQQGRLLLRIEELEERVSADVPASQSAQAPTSVPLPGLPVGTAAPAFALSGLFGETITLDFLRAQGKPVLLLFSDPGCGPCNMLMPEIGRWQRDYAGKLTLALISRGSVEANRIKASEHGITHVLLQKDREVAEAYRDQGTPGAVVVRLDGTIGTPLALGADAIRALVAGAVGLPVLQPLLTGAATNGNGNGNGHKNGHANGNGSLPIVNQPVQAARAKATSPGPDFSLPDLNGKMVSLSDFRGSKVLVLFWNPGCGFCQRMLDDLKAWETNAPAGAPKLLVVSTGSVEANQALGLLAPVLLDQNNMSVGSKFGAKGTPMAVLIDEQGNIASEVATGAPPVLALANGQDPATANNGSAPAAPAAPKVGEVAPAFALPNLSGKTVNLSDFRGNRTLVLFWNPGCGFCQRMLDDLKAWETNPPKGAPRLLIVSNGTVEANQEMNLRSTIVLDQNMSVGSKFGANGTPMAVLVDARGRIASELAVGAPAVLALAGSSKEQPKTISF